MLNSQEINEVAIMFGHLIRSQMSIAQRRLEEEGELSNVIMDFQEGEKLFGDAVRVGNKYIIGKGTNCIISYKDIKQIYQYIHKTYIYLIIQKF